MSKKKKTHKDYFGELRIPIPPPSYPLTPKGGLRGYSRGDNRKEIESELEDLELEKKEGENEK